MRALRLVWRFVIDHFSTLLHVRATLRRASMLTRQRAMFRLNVAILQHRTGQFNWWVETVSACRRSVASAPSSVIDECLTALLTAKPDYTDGCSLWFMLCHRAYTSATHEQAITGNLSWVQCDSTIKTFNTVRHVSWNFSSSNYAVSRCRLPWYQINTIRNAGRHPTYDQDHAVYYYYYYYNDNDI